MFKTFNTDKGYLTINLNHITTIEWGDPITIRLLDGNVARISQKEELLKTLKLINKQEVLQQIAQ